MHSEKFQPSAFHTGTRRLLPLQLPQVATVQHQSGSRGRGGFPCLFRFDAVTFHIVFVPNGRIVPENVWTKTWLAHALERQSLHHTPRSTPRQCIVGTRTKVENLV